MKLLIKFLVENDKLQFTFWQVILTTFIIEDIDKWINLPRKLREFKLDKYDIIIKIEITIAPEDLTSLVSEDYIKRPQFTIGFNSLNNIGSPFIGRSCEVINYYPDNSEFNNKWASFIIGEINNDGVQDNECIDITEEIIKLIHKKIGIDIVKAGSLPGCVTIYNQLPAFENHIQLKKDKNNRFIDIIAIDDLIKDCVIQVLGENANNIIFEKWVQYNKSHSHTRVDIEDYIDDFSSIKIRVYELNNNIPSKLIHEYSAGLVRTFVLNMGIGANVTRIINNRFTNNPSQHGEQKTNRLFGFTTSYAGGYTNDPWVQLHRDFENFIYGRPRKYLETEYFRKSERDKFPKWIEKITGSSKKVFIIDPYFNIVTSLDDLLVGITNTQINFIIITSNRDKNFQDNSKRQLTEEEIADKLFYSGIGRESKLIVVNKNKLHDRFIFIETDTGIRFFSMSNSWDGSLKNHNLLIQEITHRESIEIFNEFITTARESNKIYDLGEIRISKEKTNEKIFKKDDPRYLNYYKNILYKYNNDIKEYYKSCYSNSKIFKSLIRQWFNKPLKLFQSLHSIVLLDYHGSIKLSEENFKIITDHLHHYPKKKFNKLVELIINLLLDDINKSHNKRGYKLNNGLIDVYLGDATSVFHRVKQWQRNGGISFHWWDLGVNYATIFLLTFIFAENHEVVINNLMANKIDIIILEYIWGKYLEFTSKKIQIQKALDIKNWQFPVLTLFVDELDLSKFRKGLDIERRDSYIGEFITSINDKYQKYNISKKYQSLIFSHISDEIARNVGNEIINDNHKINQVVYNEWKEAEFSIISNYNDEQKKYYSIERFNNDLLRNEEYLFDLIIKGYDTIHNDLSLILITNYLSFSNNIQKGFISFVKYSKNINIENYKKIGFNIVNDPENIRITGEFIPQIAYIIKTKFSNDEIEELIYKLRFEISTFIGWFFRTHAELSNVNRFYLESYFILTLIYYISFRHGNIEKLSPGCKNTIDIIRTYIIGALENYPEDYYSIGINTYDLLCLLSSDTEKRWMVNNTINPIYSFIVLSHISSPDNIEIEKSKKYVEILIHLKKSLPLFIGYINASVNYGLGIFNGESHQENNWFGVLETYLRENINAEYIGIIDASKKFCENAKSSVDKAFIKEYKDALKKFNPWGVVKLRLEED